MKKKLIILLCSLTSIVVLYRLGIYIPCPLFEIAGLYCPGCGISRCILSILKFDFYAAFRYNPLLFILLPFLSSYAFYKLIIWILGKRDTITKKIPKYPIYILIVVLIGYGILRNTSDFSWLAPTKVH